MQKLRKYTPISCLFFDRLQDWATRKEIVELTFFNKDFKGVSKSTRILDIFTKESEEFIVLESGEKFRLDLLISVNEFKVSKCEIDLTK